MIAWNCDKPRTVSQNLFPNLIYSMVFTVHIMSSLNFKTYIFSQSCNIIEYQDGLVLVLL